MARRSGSRKSTAEQMVMKIYGLRPNGDVASISVYQKGRSVRLSGPNGPHNVHPSNVGNSDGWIREARLVWKLTDIYHEHPVHADPEESRERLAALKAKGEELKRTL